MIPKEEWWQCGSVIVSNRYTGWDDASTLRAYGGHLVCESVSTEHGSLLLNALQMKELLKELLLGHFIMSKEKEFQVRQLLDKTEERIPF